MEHVVGRRRRVVLGLGTQDRDAGLELGGLDVGDESGEEPAPQAVLQRRDRPGGRSEVRTICFEASWSELKVWKNSSCRDSFPRGTGCRR